jgi:hypothetical protein
MERTATPNVTVERLLRDLDPVSDDPLAVELAGWLTGSARFRGFAEENRAKIRKKLRGATDPEARLDVRAELRTAHLLLADRRFELAYEAYGSGRSGPDFTVTFHGSKSFNVEVTRLRGSAPQSGPIWQLLAKLRQLPPSAPNVVLVAIEGRSAEALDVAGSLREFRAHADSKDAAFFESRGFAGTREFNERYLRLGAVLVWAEAAAADARAAAWINRSARIALPDHAAQACLACLWAG